MNVDDYVKEKQTIDLMKANGFAIKCLLVSALVFGIPYFAIWGWNSTPLFEGFYLKIFYPIIFILAGIVLHELIHGIFFALYAKGGFSSIKFGVLWKYLAPYCHCKEALKIKHYTITLFAPLVFTGILPSIIALIIGNFPLLVVGIFLCSGAAGDLMIYEKLKKENPEDYVQDHPSEAGYFILRKPK